MLPTPWLLAALLSSDPARIDCGYRSPAAWAEAVRAGVARGEIADPAARARGVSLPPRRRAGGTSGALAAPGCLTTDHLFAFEDTAGVLSSDFSDAELVLFMRDALNALLAAHGDEFDFVGFFTNFTAHHELGLAFYLAIMNDVSGIGDPSTLGTPIFDHHGALGLDGQRIQGCVMMWNVDHPHWRTGTGPEADVTRLGLAHEYEHRFALFLPPLLDGRVMQGDDGNCGRTYHWSWRADGQGSAMEISDWVGSSPASLAASFISFNTDTGGVYSWTDLYLMGFASPAEMDAGNSELRFMNGSSCAPTHAGTITHFASSDLIAAAGPRVPDSTASQKDYRSAWIVVHRPGQPPTPTQEAKIVAILQQHRIDYAFGTLGRGTMEHTLFDDCDCDGLDDVREIALGTALDGNGNGVPDPCEPGVGSVVCAGDGTGAPCPCGNSGASGHGCAHSEHAEGALLAAFGTTSPDTVALDATLLRDATLTVFFKGDAALAVPLPFGDGLRCVGGTLRRFGAQTGSSGSATFPGGSGTTLSAAGGNVPGSGQVAFYQALFRDGAPSFCTSERVNATNAIQIVW